MSFGFGVGDFLAVLELANKVRKRIVEAPRDFKVLDAEMRHLSITLQDVDIWLHNASAKQKESALVVLQECQELLREIQQLLDKSTVLQAPQKPGGGQKLRDKFKALGVGVTWDPEDIKNFQLRIISNITKLNHTSQTRTQVDVDSLVAHKDHQQLSELVKWISPYDYAMQQRDILCKRVEKSASQWLLESDQFSAWLKEPGKTMFCPGIPGAGKTMTTAIVVDHLQSSSESNSLTAFVYCSYRNPEQHTQDQLIASVLRSLVQQLPRPPDSIQCLFDTEGRKGRLLTAQQIYSGVKSISESVDRINVLIDALDELPIQTREDTISTMLKLQADIGVNLFLTSRFNVGIEEKIHPDPALTIEIRAAPVDVQKYLRANLSRLPRCVSGKDEIQKLIVRSITEVVDGMFLLAELHLNSLQNKTSTKEIRTALSRLSSGSNAYTAAYDEAWNRINAQPEEHKSLAKQAIAILVTARRPLSVEELCHALSVDTENEQVDEEEDMRDIEDILATCAGLVTTDMGSNTVRLVHMSAQDHFHRHRAEFFPDAEHTIGRICVIYRRVKNSDPKHAFYSYADKKWWSHLDKATVDQEVVKQDSAVDSRPTHGIVCSKLASELSVQLGLEMFSSDPTLYTTMLRACEIGNQSLLESLLGITRFDLPKDSKLLAMAVKNGFEDIVKTLLGRGASPNSCDDSGNPIIFEAIERDYSNIVQLLLDFEGDVECRHPFGDETPLLWAAARGSLSCLKLLLKVGNVHAVDIQDKGVLSLAIQSQRRKFEAVEMLLRCPKVDVLQCDDQGTSPLFWAVYIQQPRIVRALLKNSQIKASFWKGVNRRNNRRVLTEAFEMANDGVIRALLESDAVTHNCCTCKVDWEFYERVKE